MNIISQLNDKDAEEVKSAFVELLRDYLSPAFGSISKRDFDILLFMKLQNLGLIDKNPEIYELVSDLKVTRAKARNLLYEAKLRASTSEDLDGELKELLVNPIFLKDQDKIGIEIGNPYLIDHLRFKLKKLNHITDGSFSPELVKLTIDAYISIFESYLPETSKQKIIDSLIKIGVVSDTSFSGVLTSILKKLGTKVADNAGGQVGESIGGYLKPIIDGSISSIAEKFSLFFVEENES
ncbi:hypothetical protein RZR97_10425 [Hydrogenimonas thermophila]|uniref:hypothetical protein n=1 Tax=Hydrogenimonas thermophila TaxID=223786 RepID=UPI002936F7E6|nr:hypothetical protein [Hydrogenimonas thermophila]WOE69514.1 hypothetical protein RZR91_10450 [Hydrogenimonas thermophila]WOE72025.1 hypothetical protein RZR97_10425 [Hydrogenimonas thermophila]